MSATPAGSLVLRKKRPNQHGPRKRHDIWQSTGRLRRRQLSLGGMQRRVTKKVDMLTLYRRHLRKWPHRAKGGNYVKCSCPIWADGELDGKRYRKSLGTRDWQRALRKKGEVGR